MRDESLKLLVYEHISGGGFSGNPIQTSILCEGFGMLRSIISDLKAAGHYVTTILDSRIAKLNPPIFADSSIPVSSIEETQTRIKELAARADAAYMIAPETDNTLASFVELVEKMGIKSLNCSASAIKKLSNKACFYEIIRKYMPIPETVLLSVFDDLKEVTKTIRDCLNFPAIFKPMDGVSCDGISIVKKEEQIARAIAKIKSESRCKSYIAQEFVTGDAASVSLFSTGSNVLPVSLNSQDIKLQTAEFCSTYNGGVIPFEHPLRQKVFDLAKEFANFVPGLRGYISMDFVLTDETAVAIEVNPRLTTSYIGLRRILNFNPAQAIIDAVLKNELPTEVESCGFTYFSKVKTPIPSIRALQETYMMERIVSPPFPVSERNMTSALILSHGDTLQEATVRFREAKRYIFNSIIRGKQRW